MLAFVLAASVLIGVTLGLLGGGGSVLTTPLLLYGLDVAPKQAIATSLAIVGVTSLAAVARHARAGNVVWRTGFAFGGAGMIGAYAGGRIAAFVPESALLLLFAGMMLATAAAMFRGRRDPGPGAAPAGPPLGAIVALGVAVGAVTGLVGAGGGFVVVPALALLGGLPMPKAVGTSLLVLTLQSLAGALGHAAHVAIDLPLAATVSTAAVAGSFLGSALSTRIPPEALRRAFAVFVLATAGFVLYQQT